MKRSIWFLIFVITLFLWKSNSALSQKAKVVKWLEVEKILAEKSDSLTVINFWATWCKPCVLEIPHFETVRKKMKDKPVRFRYISLDFKDQKKTKLDPFISKKMEGSTVWLLDETNYDLWINKIDPAWEGTIPVTVLLNNSKKIRKFVAREISETELEQLIQTLL
jgi:thiol-disulfide isomerase/thioredoxin